MPMDPRSYVAVKEIPNPSHVGLYVTARSSKPVYTCEYPTRKQVAKANYERRRHQKLNCGYGAAIYKPYQAVGEVILDEKELILKTLGQAKEGNYETKRYKEEPEEESSSNANEYTKVDSSPKAEPPEHHQPLNESNLQSVHSQIVKGRKMMNKVKLGVGLFKVIHEEQRKKEILHKQQEKEEQEKSNSMKVLAVQDSSDEESEADLSRYLVTLPDRELGYSSSSESEDGLQWQSPMPHSVASVSTRPVNTSRSNSGSSVKSFINISRWHRAGSAVALNRERRLKKGGQSSQLNEKSNNEQVDESRSSSPQFEGKDSVLPDDDNTISPNRLSKDFLAPSRMTGYNNHVRRSSKASVARSTASIQSLQLANAKKFKKSLPRPFSPIHTNINFYETLSREHTFRQLCVVNWILEAMSQDQQPAIMPPILTCWTLRELKEDAKVTKKKVERDKAVDPMWKSFLSNPNRFSQGRTGRRSTLYQRRVSVAPTTLLKLSSIRSNSVASNATQSTKWGYQAENPSDSENEKPRRDSGIPHGRNASPMAADRDSDGDNRAMTRMSSVSFQVPQGERKRSSVQMTNSNRSATSGFRDKAFVVRDVLLAKPENIPKAKSPSKSLGTSINRKMSTGSESDSEEEDRTNFLRKQGLQKDSMNWKTKFAAAAIATFGAISTNSKTEELPKEQKRKFQEVKEEQALVVHDNIEVMERNRLQSMERKFCSLHVVTDVFKAITLMRTEGKLNIETDEERKARYSVECIWYKNLLQHLPTSIREDPDCAIALDKIAHYGSLEGRKISPTQFLKVLSLLRSWELCDPDISAAVEYVRDKIVQMDREKFEDWVKTKMLPHKRSASAPI